LERDRFRRAIDKDWDGRGTGIWWNMRNCRLWVVATMKFTDRLQTLVAALGLGGHVLAQGTFRNLNFESANLAVIPPGQFGNEVSPEAAIPSWTPSGAAVFQNSVSIGGPSITVYGPEWDARQILQGKYSVHINNDFFGRGSAAIAQTGEIPGDSRSLIFLTDPLPALAVSFAGHPLSFVRLVESPQGIKWGADITTFAGQTGELRFSAGPGFAGGGTIDNIQFSTRNVPEPGIATLVLVGLSAFTVAWWNAKARSNDLI
jgi:hypothetical protein